MKGHLENSWTERNNPFKKCWTCKELKPHSEYVMPAPFYIKSYQCTPCRKSRGSFPLHSEIRKKLKSLTNYRCQICKSREAEESLCVDHCHEKVEFRGILCSQCNAAIGKMGDSPEKLQSLLAYLHRTENIDLLRKTRGRTYFSGTKLTLSVWDRELLNRLRPDYCQACGEKPESSLNIDHCHLKEIVRGFLCFNCNLALGLFYDTEEYIENAIAYLEGKPALEFDLSAPE